MTEPSDLAVVWDMGGVFVRYFTEPMVEMGRERGWPVHDDNDEIVTLHIDEATEHPGSARDSNPHSKTSASARGTAVRSRSDITGCPNPPGHSIPISGS